jgi:8-oxo-dGTP pyrophosphatase MutT (NUDIX family)
MLHVATAIGTPDRGIGNGLMPNLVDGVLRMVFTAAFTLLKRRARSRPGVHAIALTPERRLILVKLRYAPGMRLPGGGRDEKEDPLQAGLRELREEIGLVSHGPIQMVRAEKGELLILEEVRYRPPPWSWEVQEVREAQLDALPADLSPISARMLALARDRL